MHYHVINEALDVKDRIVGNRKNAEILFETYMYAAAVNRLTVESIDRWDWKVQNPKTKEWYKVSLEECIETHLLDKTT